MPEWKRIDDVVGGGGAGGEDDGDDASSHALPEAIAGKHCDAGLCKHHVTITRKSELSTEQTTGS